MIVVLLRKLRKRKVDLEPKTFAPLAHLNRGARAYPNAGVGVATVLNVVFGLFRLESDAAGPAGKYARRSSKKARQVR